MANSQNTPSGKKRCVGCGAELLPNSTTELCPKCLLKLAMQTQPGPGGTVAMAEAEGRSRGLPEPGEQFGHYMLVRALGAGGMGAVYEAEDLESGRRVALKVLSHRLDSPEARERFLREGRLAASINHPNSVYIFGTEEVGGTPVITMELVSGGTLQDRVRARGPLPIGEAVDAVLQIIEGLEAAQRVGILHRDVKPSNCYRGEDGSVKIGDFGLSISTGVRTEPALTTTGAFLGTPAFCSPEQLRGEELNARSDMYSVGVTLFYMLTGRTPFEARNLVQMLATVFEQRPPSPRQFRPEIPKGLATAVLRCLEKQSGERFKSYADLAEALGPYASKAPTPATLSLRFVAGVVDMVLLLGLATTVNVSAFGSPLAFLDGLMRLAPRALACLVGWLCVGTFYFALCEGWWGAAAGKALCRLRVVGRDRNPPGIGRAWLRALVFVVPPLTPFWGSFYASPKAYLNSPLGVQLLVGMSSYVVMGLLFVTARRRNGFAALQDLLTRTQVVSRAAVGSRAVAPTPQMPAPVTESALSIGPYQVLQALPGSGGTQWFLAYDLKLLRKVWVRVVPPGTPPVPLGLRALGRVGRLRWLTGKRVPEQNWDAFEAPDGRPFLELITASQSWGEVRYWLHDLATEMGTAQAEGTLPELALDRIWITGEGRAKLLDFPAPGLAMPAVPAPGVVPPPLPPIAFLNQVAAAALNGSLADATQSAGEVAAPLPLHARAFLKSLSRMTGTEAVAVALKPLLGRTAVVTRWRRAALVTGCLVFPVICGAFIPFTWSIFRDMTQKQPGVMELSQLLQVRHTSRFLGGARRQMPGDRDFQIYIAHHYRGLITNQVGWTSFPVMSMIRGADRKFAEQSVADYPAPTEAEIAQADAAVGKYVPKESPFASQPTATMSAFVLAAALVAYVSLPALVAALLFRGGVVLLIAGVTYVRRDGARASRLRLLWRAVVVWLPVLVMLLFTGAAWAKHWTWQPWLALALLGVLAAVSVSLPGRGLQDRLAGTWPVPR